MRAAFGEDFEELLFPPDADQRIQLQIRWRSLQRERSAADISDGTLRFLFLLAVLANPSPAPLIAIDEPETGLHPSMLPIVAEYAREAANRATGDPNHTFARIPECFWQRPSDHNRRGTSRRRDCSEGGFG